MFGQAFDRLLKNRHCYWSLFGFGLLSGTDQYDRSSGKIQLLLFKNLLLELVQLDTLILILAIAFFSSRGADSDARR